VSVYLQFFSTPGISADEKVSSVVFVFSSTLCSFCFLSHSLMCCNNPNNVQSKVAVDSDKPKVNMGVPVVIVGTRADLGSRYLAKSGSGRADEMFEYLTRRLRKTCLDYGAALIFTSAAGKGSNVEQLQDYVFHRLYGFDLEQKPKAVGANEDFLIFVPAGWDSTKLIETAGAMKIKEETKFDEVFANPLSKKAKKEVQRVDAMEFSTFVKNFKFSQDSTPPPRGAATAAAAANAVKRTPSTIATAVPLTAAASPISPTGGTGAGSTLGLSPDIAKLLAARTPSTTTTPAAGGTAPSADRAAALLSAVGAGSSGAPKTDDKAAVKNFFQNMLKGGAGAKDRANAAKLLEGRQS